MPSTLTYAANPWNATGCEMRPPLTGLAPSYKIKQGSGLTGSLVKLLSTSSQLTVFLISFCGMAGWTVLLSWCPQGMLLP